MSTIKSPKIGNDLLQHWKRQVGGRLNSRHEPRCLAALGFLVKARMDNGFVDLRRFMLTVLHDVDAAPIATRFAGYRGVLGDGQIEWGGATQCMLDKNLALYPAREALGTRIDIAHRELLELALRLDRRLERHHLRYRHMPRSDSPRLPRIWAAATQFEFPGSAATPVRYYRRRRLVPLEEVLERPDLTRDLFVDLRSVPKVQVFAVGEGLESLQGRADHVAFDLLASRFRRALA